MNHDVNGNGYVDDDDDDDLDHDCLIGCMRVSETKPLCRVLRKG